MNWTKAMVLTQLALLVVLLWGYWHFNKKYHEREEIFQDALNYVLSHYDLESCACIANDGSQLFFSPGKIKIAKNFGSPYQDINLSSLEDMFAK